VKGRALWSAGWISLSLFVAAVAQAGPIVGAALAGSVAVVLPLLDNANIATSPRSLSRRSRPAEEAQLEPAVEPKSLDEVLCTSIPPDPRAVDQELAADSLSCLDEVTTKMLTDLFWKMPLVDDRPIPGRRLTISPETTEFLTAWPPLALIDPVEEKARELIRLMYRTMLRQGRPPQRKKVGDPTDEWIASHYLLMRAGVATDKAGRDTERIERLRFRLWSRRLPASKKGVPGVGPRYEVARILEMSEAELIAALDSVRGRDRYEASKKMRQRSISAEVSAALDHWRSQLAAGVGASVTARR
jgi:hypothetical protein